MAFLKKTITILGVGRKTGVKELLLSGYVYEYARETRKLRCLLALVKSAPFRGLEFLNLSFEGLRYRDALQALGGWFGWLRMFTDQLADNKSFADVCETLQGKLNESLATLPEYFFAPKAVELSLPDLMNGSYPGSDGLRRRCVHWSR